MSPQSTPTLSTRIQKAAETLGIEESDLMSALSDAGVENNDDGLRLLEANTTTEEVIVEDVLASVGPKLKRRAAAAILKGKDPFSPTAKEQATVTGSTSSENAKVFNIDGSAEAFRSLIPISQWKDRELLEAFDKDREARLEEELERRSKGQRFLVLKSSAEDVDPGTEPIDIETSLQLLKKTRRMKIPTIIPGPDNKVYPVYRLSELNMDERVVELCPICGEILFRGYCEPCELNWSDVEDSARAFVALVVQEGKLNTKSASDRRALLGDAVKGVMQLRQVWPSVEGRYRELKLTDNLPRLKMVKSLPAEQVKDPFHPSGHRQY